MHFATVWESISDVIPDKIALIHGDEQRTWGDFDDRAARLASALAAHGLGADSKVAQYLYNGTEYMEVAYAAFKIGGVPINTNYRYLEEELVYLVDNSDAEALVFHGSLGDRVAKVRDRLTKVKLLVQVDDGEPLIDGAVAYEDLLAQHEPAPRIARAENGVYMLYTGGTTGMPKGVMYDVSGFTTGMMSGHAITGALPAKAEDVAPSVIKLHESGLAPTAVVCCPLMHGTGLWIGGFITLNAGGTVVTLESKSFDANEMFQTVARHKATNLIIVGDAFAKPMVRELEAAEAKGTPHDLSSIRTILSSGVMWTSETKQALLERHDMTLLDIMGSTEGGMAQNTTTRENATATAQFQLNPTAKVFTDDDRLVGAGSGEIGMIATTGMVPLGYFKDKEKSERTFRTIDGVRYSFPGDYATIEADGTIKLLGRGSACVNSGGEKIFPEEVEEAVKRHPSVYDCLVVGVPDEKFGEAVTAVASLREGKTATQEEIVQNAREHLSSFKLPKRVLLVDKVQRAPNGKADYKWAKDHALKELGL
jgi:fatty-acyl-CoA synthase